MKKGVQGRNRAASPGNLLSRGQDHAVTRKPSLIPNVTGCARRSTASPRSSFASGDAAVNEVRSDVRVIGRAPANPQSPTKRPYGMTFPASL
jgi:hypothetical protein